MEIFWRLILNTKDAKKADQIKNKFLTSIDSPCKTITFEVYWKDPTKYLLEVSEHFVQVDPTTIMDTVAKKICRISNIWNLNIIYAGDLLSDLSGTCSESIKVVGVDWITFTLEQ
jgi:hypothetical protein